MEPNAMFDALKEVVDAAAEFKQVLMENYHKLNQDDQNKAVADMKEHRRKVYNAFDMLTPDEIREYGRYVAVMESAKV